MSDNYIYADLHRMIELPKCAVLVRTEEEATAFFYNARQQLSEYNFHTLEDTLLIWSDCKDKTGFTLFGSRDEYGALYYCDEDWFREEGYEIVEFSDLCAIADIAESDQPVDILFC